MELLVIPRLLKAQRVEIGVEVATHAIGADHHERAHGIAGRPANVVVARRRFWPGLLRPGAQLLGDRLFRRRPIAVQCVDEIPLGARRPIGFPPRRPAFGFGYARRIIPKRSKKLAPAGFDRLRVLLVLRLQRFDVGAVGPVQKRGLQQSLINVLTSHRADSLYLPCNKSTNVLPSRAGEGETRTPAASIAAILSSAPPLPPAMIAPACPMRRPEGAVRPAMKPTTGFERRRLASSLRNSAASSSA